MAIFPGKPGSAGYNEAKDDGSGGDYTGAVRRAKQTWNRVTFRDPATQ